jgi:hypothetical protein
VPSSLRLSFGTFRSAAIQCAALLTNWRSERCKRHAEARGTRSSSSVLSCSDWMLAGRQMRPGEFAFHHPTIILHIDINTKRLSSLWRIFPKRRGRC